MGSDVHCRPLTDAKGRPLTGRPLTDAKGRPPTEAEGGTRDDTAPPASPPAARRRSLRPAADAVLAAVVFALFARTFLFQAFEVPSPSMEKTVLTGDRIVVNKFVYAPA